MFPSADEIKKKKVPSFEEVMQDKPKVPSYDEVMGESQKKKSLLDFSTSSLEAGNSLSQSIGEVGAEIPTIEMYTTPSGEMVEANPIALSKKYNELSNRTTLVSDMDVATSLPDEEAQKSAKKLKEDFKEIDLGGIYEETKYIPDDVLANVGKELMQDREQNNPLYQRKLANIKWRNEFEDKILNDVDKGNITPDDYNRIKDSIDKLPEFTGTGDFTNQRTAIKSLANDIQLYGGENREKILENFATEVSKVYGNAYNNKFSEAIKDTPESKYLNEDAQLGLQYLEDIAPEKSKQYGRLKVDPKTLKDNPDALKGYNHLMQTLEETGIGLQQNSVTEELNNLKRIAERNGELTEEQYKKATDLETKQAELTQKRNELDAKYPDRIEDKVDDAMQEILGQSTSGLNYVGGTAFKAIKNTAQGIWEAVSTPFMSDASNTMRELSIMGESLEENKIYHKTDKNQALLTDKMVIEPELQTQIDAIKNNKLMTEEQKGMKLYRLLKDNTDKFGRVPIKGGKWNINGASIAYGLSDLGTTLLPFVALEAATGGGATAGLARKFLTTFSAAAATTFHDEYAHALLNGKSQSEAYKEAMGMTAISSLAMAGAGTPQKIKAMVNPRTSSGKLILSMSDDAIQKVLDKGGSKTLNAIKNRIKATPAMVKGGLKTGAEFEVAMTAANELKHQIYDTEIDREANLKHSLLAIGNFGILGAGLGHIGYKSPTEMQKGAGLLFGEKPDSYVSIAEQMRKNGQLTEKEFDHRVDLINKFGDAYKTLPKSLNEKQKADYLYQTVIKNEANKGKSELPPKQAAEAEKTALVADHTRDLISKPPTDKQLEDRRGVLERKLEPKKDAEGKSIELPEKEKLDMEAELEAVNNVIKERTEAPKPPEVKGEPEQISETKELRNQESNAEGFYPENISQPVELSTEVKEIKNEPITEVKETVEVPITTEKEVITEPMVSEVVSEAGGKKEPPKEPTETVVEGDDVGGITHAANEVRRMDRRLPEYEKEPQKFEQWNNEAEQKINDGYDVEKLMNEIEKGKDPNPVENAIRKIYIATLDAEIAKNPTDALLAKQKRFIEIGDLANSRAGRNLVSLKGEGSPLSSISDFYVAKMDALGAETLTEAQKAEVKKQYEHVQKTNEEATLKIQKLEEENAKLRAEAAVKKTRSSTKKDKKDFVKEREDIKKNILDKWNKSKNVGFTPDPSKDLLMDIAPDVAKLVKSYIQEGVVKLEELVKKVHDELKGYIPNITEKNINDIIAGQYDTPKETKGDLLSKLRGIKDKKSEEAVKLKARINAGDFATPKKAVSWVDNPEIKKNFPKEYNAALDAIKAKEDARHEFDIALLRDEMSRRTKGEKITDALSKTAGTIKAITTGIDDSAVAIQTYVSMLVRPRTGVKAFYQHIRQGFSQKKFDRWLSALHSSPDFKEMREMGLDVTEPSSLKEREKEEIFNNRFSGTIKVKGKEYKLLDAPLKPFERAFTTLGNVTRVVGYRTISDKYKREGYTPEKDPELFKSLAKRLNTETGRGEVNEYVDMANKVVTMGIWSPKLMAQKFNILGVSDLASLVLSKAGTKGYYRQLHPKERLAAIGDVAQFATTVMALSYGFALANGGKVDDDPLSSTYMDVKLPNGKSYNFTGGFSGYIRAISQFAMGKKNKDEQSKDVNRLETAGRFFRGKTPPLTSAVLNTASGKNFMGEETTVGEEVVNLAPMSLRGIVNQIKNDGAESFFTQGIPTFFGFNVKNEKDYQSKSDYTQDELKDPTLKYYSDKGINFPEFDPEKIVTKEVNNKDVEKLSEYDQKTQDEFIAVKKKYLKEGLQELKDGYIQIYKDEDGEVSTPSESEDLTGKEPIEFKDLTTEQLQYLVSKIARKATIKTKEEIDLKSSKKNQ